MRKQIWPKMLKNAWAAFVAHAVLQICAGETRDFVDEFIHTCVKGRLGDIVIESQQCTYPGFNNFFLEGGLKKLCLFNGVGQSYMANSAITHCLFS